MKTGLRLERHFIIAEIMKQPLRISSLSGSFTPMTHPFTLLIYGWQKPT
jgi:hypothetical protein